MLPLIAGYDDNPGMFLSHSEYTRYSRARDSVPAELLGPDP